MDFKVRKKRSRTVLSLHEKMIILEKLEKGRTYASLAKEYKINESSVRTIKKSEEKIKMSIKSVINPISAKSTFVIRRDSAIEKMEQLLNVWIEDQRDNNVHLTSVMIRTKALNIYNNLKAKNPESNDDTKPFGATKGWFDRFRKRANLQMKVATEDSTYPNVEKEFRTELKTIIEKGNYKPQQIFNCSEASLYWKKLPERTVISQKEPDVYQFKESMDRITLLFCTNTTGSYKCKPLLIHHLKIQKNHFPIYCRTNKESCINSSLFVDWLRNCFVPEIETYLQNDKLPFKALLILDNSPNHPPSIYEFHEKIKVLFFPPNTSTILQPMDQGIMATFKYRYFRKILEHLSESKNVRECWRKFSLLMAIKMITEAWNEVDQSIVNVCWKKLYPETVKVFKKLPSIQEEIEKILNLAKAIDGEGFCDMNEQDVIWLMQLHQEDLRNEELGELAVGDDSNGDGEDNDDDGDGADDNDDGDGADDNDDGDDDSDCKIVEEDEDDKKAELTSKGVSEILQAAEFLKQMIAREDPNIQRSVYIKRNIDSAMSSYMYISRILRKEEEDKSENCNSPSTSTQLDLTDGSSN